MGQAQSLSFFFFGSLTWQCPDTSGVRHEGGGGGFWRSEGWTKEECVRREVVKKVMRRENHG